MLMGLECIRKQVSASLAGLAACSKKIPDAGGSTGHVDSASLAAASMKMLFISQPQMSSGFWMPSLTEVNRFFLHVLVKLCMEIIALPKTAGMLEEGGW